MREFVEYSEERETSKSPKKQHFPRFKMKTHTKQLLIAK